MFFKIPMPVLVVPLIALGAVNLILAQRFTTDQMLPYRVAFAAGGLLTLMRLLLDPVARPHGNLATSAKMRIGEVTFWLATVLAAIFALFMIDQSTFLGGINPTDLLRLCIPATLFAVGRASRYVIAGY